jgi:hypothetical protein
MEELLRGTLESWHDFYVVTGSAAAALTGLQFVVQTLIASDSLRHLVGPDPEVGIAAFGTPTVVHFSLALALSGVMCVPWPEYIALHMALTLFGIGAVIYSAVVLRRALRQTIYKPELEDWIWHLTLPAVAYAVVLASGLLLAHGGEQPFFWVAGSTLLLLCIGIHNAWDTVTYMTIQAMKRPASDASGRTTLPSAGPKARRRR